MACSTCNRENTLIVYNKPRWYRDGNGGFLCHTCQVRKINLGRKHSDETKRKLSLNNPMRDNPEVRQKASKSKKGMIPWNKGKKGVQVAWNKGKELPHLRGRKRPDFSELLRKRVGSKHPNYGKHWTEEAKVKRRISRLGQVFPSRDSSIEVKLQYWLSSIHIKYETHKTIDGQPDIFLEPNICVFADGNFFHGNPLYFKPFDILSNGMTAMEIWDKDNRVTTRLQSQGYTVLRFWEHDIINNFPWVQSRILAELNPSNKVAAVRQDPYTV